MFATHTISRHRFTAARKSDCIQDASIKTLVVILWLPFARINRRIGIQWDEEGEAT